MTVFGPHYDAQHTGFANEGTSGQSYELLPKRKQPLGGSPSLMAWVRKGPAVNRAGTNVATAEPDPSPESSSSAPVLSAESISVESAAELVSGEVQSDVSTQMNTLIDY